jgi:hypothetical protein
MVDVDFMALKNKRKDSGYVRKLTYFPTNKRIFSC